MDDASPVYDALSLMPVRDRPRGRSDFSSASLCRLTSGGNRALQPKEFLPRESAEVRGSVR